MRLPPWNSAAALCALIAATLVLTVDTSRVMTFAPIAIGLVFFPLERARTAAWPPVPPLALWVLGGILALTSASLAWAEYPETSARKVVELWLMLPPMALFLAVIAAQDIERLRPWLPLIPWACAGAWVWMCVELATGGAAAEWATGRDLPPYQYNRSMIALLVPSLAALALGPRWLALATLVPMGAACLMTESQSAQVIFALGVCLYLTTPYLPLRGPWLWRGAAAALVLAMAVFPFAAPWAYTHYAAGLQENPWLAAGAAGHRLEGWDYISRYALERPWTGYGVEATRAITDFDSARVFAPGNLILHPHSALLQVWIEFGILGVFLVCAGAVALAEHLRRAYGAAPGRLRVLVPTVGVGFLVPAVLAFGMWQSWLIGMLVVTAGLLIIAMRVQDG